LSLSNRRLVDSKAMKSILGPEFTSIDPFIRKQGRIVVVHCYNTDLNLAWTIEYINLIVPKTRVELVLDLSIKNVCNETSSRSYIGRVLKGRQRWRSTYLERYLRQHGINGVRPLKLRRSIIGKALSCLIGIWLNWNPRLQRNPKIPVSLYRSVHSSMANKLSTVYYRPFFHPFALFRRILAYWNSHQNTTEILLNTGHDYGVIIPNGRLPVSAGAAQAARDLNLDTRYLERGGSPGMLDVFSESPHSMQERRNAVMRNWERGLSAFPELCVQIAKDYFSLRREGDPHSGISWQRKNVRTIDLPEEIQSSHEQVWCYFTSTELEFAVHQEEVNHKYFENQRDAILALVESIQEKPVKLIVRRHPQRKWKWFDKERKLWASIRHHKQVIWIGPKDAINSYDLGLKSDIVFHFNSSIGPELIALGHKNVITLGPTSWLAPESDKSCGSTDQILHSIGVSDLGSNEATQWAF